VDREALKETHRMNTTPRIADRGFSLIELLTVVAVVALLAGLALSSYLNQARESRRTEAKTAVLDLAGREERNYSTTNSYTTTTASLGYANGAFPFATVNGYYSLNVVVTAAAAGPPVVPATYQITATAINDQVNDRLCQVYTYTQAGAQAAADNNANDTSVACWR
jgi:type IV pilus assembly protein PilE